MLSSGEIPLIDDRGALVEAGCEWMVGLTVVPMAHPDWRKSWEPGEARSRPNDSLLHTHLRGHMALKSMGREVVPDDGSIRCSDGIRHATAESGSVEPGRLPRLLGVEKVGFHPHGHRQIQPSLNEKQRLEPLPAVDSVTLLLRMFGPASGGPRTMPRQAAAFV